jgi:hypothetical protein
LAIALIGMGEHRDGLQSLSANVVATLDELSNAIEVEGNKE